MLHTDLETMVKDLGKGLGNWTLDHLAFEEALPVYDRTKGSPLAAIGPIFPSEDTVRLKLIPGTPLHGELTHFAGRAGTFDHFILAFRTDKTGQVTCWGAVALS